MGSENLYRRHLWGRVVCVATIGLTFLLDCASKGVLCPDRAWPESITLEQYGHALLARLPTQDCSDGSSAASDCAPSPENPECEEVCKADISVGEQERELLLVSDSLTLLHARWDN